MNTMLIQQTTDIQSSIGMSGYHHTFGTCVNSARFAARTIDLSQGEVALEPATAARKGWVRGTYAWRPPSV
jgi:hypothetical protein